MRDEMVKLESHLHRATGRPRGPAGDETRGAPAYPDPAS